MPINPFQQYQEAGFGGVNLRAQQRGSGQMGAGSLAGQGHRSNPNMVAPTVGNLREARAQGSMPQGNANIGRPNYGQQGVQQEPKAEGRRSLFQGQSGGIRSGGGGGLTAGGDIKFDLSIGKTDFRGAQMQGARVGAAGMGASASDSNFGDIDQSQTYSPKLSAPGGRGGATRSSASTGAAAGAAAGKQRAPRAPRTAEQKAARNERDRARRAEAKSNPSPTMNNNSRATSQSGNAPGGRGGTIEGVDMSGVKFGSPVAQVGRSKIGRDTFTDQRNSRNVTANTDQRKMPAPKAAPAAATPAPAPKNVSKAATKSSPKAEAESKSKAKESAKKSVEKAVEKGPSTAAKAKRATKAKKEEEEK